MDVVQSVESAPVHAARDVGAVMVFPVMEKGKVVVPGWSLGCMERGEASGTREAEEFPDRQ
jgi:hypothetical protein